MEDEIVEVLSAYKDSIDLLLARVDEIDKMVESYHEQYDDRFHKIEDQINNDILGPAEEAFKRVDHDKRFGDFTSKYGAQLGAFNDKLHAIEGPDFDLTTKAFDDYNAIEGDKPDEGAYVEQLVKKVEAQLEAIKQAMGIGADATVEVEKKGDEPATVEVEDTDTQTVEEKAGHTTPSEVETEDEEVVEDDPEEVKKFQEDLEKYKENK